MRAMIIKAFGGPDVFEARDLPVPEPGAGELLVKVCASGTNPVEAKIRQNGTWAAITPPAVLGYDVSGIVAAVGAGVTDFKLGDEVYYTPEVIGNGAGSYAEYNVVHAAIVARKPKNLTHTEAAAVPLAGGTAWEAMVRRLAIRPGETARSASSASSAGTSASCSIPTAGSSPACCAPSRCSRCWKTSTSRSRDGTRRRRCSRPSSRVASRGTRWPATSRC